MDRLRFAGAETQRRNCRIAVAIGRDKGAVQMRHHAHLMPKRRQTRVDWNPIGVNFGKVTCIADIEWCAALRDDCHSKRTRLPAKSRAIVISPKRSWREIGMQLPCNFPLRERVLVHSAWRGDNDSRAGHWQRLNILG